MGEEGAEYVRQPLTQLADGPFWQVIGGADKGGIVTRDGRGTDSNLIDRLQTGSIIKQLEYYEEDGRVKYELKLGKGPQTGWVSVKLKDGKELLNKSTMLKDSIRPNMKSDMPAPPLMDFPAIGDRPIRILALHGSPSNSNIMHYQLTLLKKYLGRGIQWLTPNGLMPWIRPPQPPGGNPNIVYNERSETEMAVARDMPFTCWIELSELESGIGMDVRPGPWEEVMDYFVEYCERHGPIDVALSFSSGAAPIMERLDELRKQGKDAPWRLTVLISPNYYGPVWDTDDSALPFTHKPTWMTTSKADPDYEKQMKQYKGRCSNLKIWEHGDGHAFPVAEPRASEIFKEIAEGIREFLGVPEPEAKAEPIAEPWPVADLKALMPMKGAERGLVIVEDRQTHHRFAATYDHRKVPNVDKDKAEALPANFKVMTSNAPFGEEPTKGDQELALEQVLSWAWLKHLNLFPDDDRPDESVIHEDSWQGVLAGKSQRKKLLKKLAKKG
jgi:hypothetical protein